MKKTVIILGSSRSNGNTKKIIDEIIKINSDIDLIDLNDYSIGYFNYEFSNNDDFIPLMKKIILFDQVILATPVYWYTMSAQLKTFIDRFTDLLIKEKKLGRKLKTKGLFVISCGNSCRAERDFYSPFKLFAKYLKMNYKGDLSTCIKSDDNGVIRDSVMKKIRKFSQKINNE
jgi:multimeric flavodoxin WrbA